MGQYCETEINECDEQPCKNGATCYHTPGLSRSNMLFCLVATLYYTQWAIYNHTPSRVV